MSSFPLYGQIRQTFNRYFRYFPQKIGVDISCKLSPVEVICMNCQNLLSWKNKEVQHISICRSL